MESKFLITRKESYYRLFMPEIIGPVESESDPEISSSFAGILDDKTGAIAFIAPYVSARVTPSKSVSASISIPEEFGMEDVIGILKENGAEKILLLLNSFGGGVTSSYKIARMLRDSFDDITVFVPNISASGGTLIALTGNRIVMGDMSNLSPLDVQVTRNRTLVSVNAMLRSFNAMNAFFKNKHETDAPYPWVAMANKIDPVEFQEWVDISNCMEQHAREILSHPKSSLKSKTEDIIRWLSTGCPNHSYAITFQEAKNNLGEDYVFHCTDSGYSSLWEPMRKWLRKYMFQESGYHFMRYILNNKKEEVKTEEVKT
jgi:hypothetical protein